MERIILRDQIKEEIRNRKVLAAIFHTFSFDPVFFENFVMPLFVPGKDFRDEAIYNKILWRYCAKENLIPPVAVFCDYYAKDSTQAPSLGYDVKCIKVPAAPGYISNFHPKHIFLLVEDENNNQALLLITGSGNLTPSGWCDNFECFSVLEVNKTKTFPNKSATNALQDYIIATGELAGLKYLLPAEEAINDFLKYVDFKARYFNSFISPFFQFLENENLFSKDEISEVEIISPYFNNDTVLIEKLKSKGVKKVRCLIPTLRTNEVLVDKETFIRFQRIGVEWCYWSDNKANAEVRNQHSKIYRFYGKKHCYTFIGSANFTNPAWQGFTKRKNKGNIESGILYLETIDSQKLLKNPLNLNIESLLFIAKEDLENGVASNQFERNAPDIDFVIDWNKKILIVNSKQGNKKCRFYRLFDESKILNGKSEIKLSEDTVKQLAKNAILKVAVTTVGVESVYTYYPVQKNIETKPLGFKLNANTVLKYWQFFDDEIERERITKKLVERATDESGIIDEKKIETKLLLNEMAAHFSGLVKIEKYLFEEKLSSKDKVNAHFKNIHYYLLTENIDTVPFYLNDLRQQLEQGAIQKSFFWMIIQILNNLIYAKAENWEHSWALDKATWKEFKSDIKAKREVLVENGVSVMAEIPDLSQKWNWVIEELIANNG